MYEIIDYIQNVSSADDVTEFVLCTNSIVLRSRSGDEKEFLRPNESVKDLLLSLLELINEPPLKAKYDISMEAGIVFSVRSPHVSNMSFSFKSEVEEENAWLSELIARYFIRKGINTINYYENSENKAEIEELLDYMAMKAEIEELLDYMAMIELLSWGKVPEEVLYIVNHIRENLNGNGNKVILKRDTIVIKSKDGNEKIFKRPNYDLKYIMLCFYNALCRSSYFSTLNILRDRTIEYSFSMEAFKGSSFIFTSEVAEEDNWLTELVGRYMAAADNYSYPSGEETKNTKDIIEFLKLLSFFKVLPLRSIDRLVDVSTLGGRRK